ncbi:MAG: hypothetical protein IJN20_04160 [Oscillospiraceae bacterium]|nr:hypothetical protein [Oscillospiraceae bacterium]
MANQRNANQRRPSGASGSRNTRRPPDRRHQNTRRRRKQESSFLSDLIGAIQKLRPKPDFKPDSEEFNAAKFLYLTQVQRDRFLKWGLYIALILGLTMIQDVIMSQITLFEGTTDLAVCIILLITVIEGVEIGSVFVLAASCFFYFSGSSPGPWAVGLLTFLGIGACLFRQLFWHRNQGSIVLCAGTALMLYELANFGIGIFLELTRWDRLSSFLVTGLISVAVMIPLYTLINAIGQIGGNTWKE